MRRFLRDFVISLLVSSAVLIPIGEGFDSPWETLLWMLIGIPGILFCIAALCLFLLTGLRRPRPAHVLGFVAPFIIGSIVGFIEIDHRRAELLALEMTLEKPLPAGQVVDVSRVVFKCEGVCTMLLDQRGDTIISQSDKTKPADRYVKEIGAICLP